VADRALIIAVEKYDEARSGLTAKKLPGTLAAAKRFRAWLEAKWTAEGVTGAIEFCSTPKQPGGRGAASDDIIEALAKIEQEGRDQTENLYVYFSGHGFRVRGETLKLADVLVAADFKDVQRSAAACFKLDALVDGLRGSLGFGCHFYFIDACRNEVENAIGSNIMPFAGRGNAEPSVFVLQSTVAGAPALVAGPFATKLVDGLGGAGTAKVWDPPGSDAMQVRFDTLRVFLKNALGTTQPISQSTSGEIGESEAVLATIRPIPKSKLTIALRTTLTPIKGTATITAATGVSSSHAIASASTTITLPAHHHTVALAIDGAADVSPASAVADLRDDLQLEFDAIQPGETVGVGITGGGGTTRVEVAPGAEVRLRHIGTGTTETFRSSTNATLAPGDYETTVRTSDGQILGRRQVEVGPGRPAVAPTRWQGSLPHETIAGFFPQQSGSVDFSESLGGPIADPDLGLWLAILGAGRIVGSGGMYRKIRPLPLQEFSGEPAGASPIYVLAGFDDRATPLSASLGRARARRTWTVAEEPPGMPGIKQAVLRPQPGQCFVTFQLGNQPAYTLASFASPNRCTLIVVTTDEDGQPRVAQYLLPFSHLEQHLAVEVQTSLKYRRQERTPLRDVQLLTQLYRAFRKRRNIGMEFSAKQLDDLLYAKWLEPIGASLAAYELIRRGKTTLIPTAAANMKQYFAELPDTSAIARFAGESAQQPNGVPLFLDGVRAFGSDRGWLPFDPGLLDYIGPWTAWRGAVPSPRR